MINGKYKKGDEVKFDGRTEPCIIYRVFDPQEVIVVTDLNGHLPCPVPKPCIFLEVMGYVPTELLVPVLGHPGNVYAFEQLLKQNGRLS